MTCPNCGSTDAHVLSNSDRGSAICIDCGTVWGAPSNCTGEYNCPAPHHVHGCYADRPCQHGEEARR